MSKSSDKHDFACTALGPVSLGTGQTVSPGGEKFTLELPLSPHDQRLVDDGLITPLTPLEQSRELSRLNRGELDELATGAGVEEPEKLPSKAAVIAAIEEAEATGSGESDQQKEGEQ